MVGELLVATDRLDAGINRILEKTFKLSGNLNADMTMIRTLYANSDDFVTKTISIGSTRIKGALLYVEGLVDAAKVGQMVVETATIELARSPQLEKLLLHHDIIELLRQRVLATGEAKIVTTVDQVMLSVISGSVALLVDGRRQVLTVSVQGWEKRQVAEPTSEGVVRGPKEGFIETLRINTALLRRKIRDPNLKIQITRVGRRSKTDVALIFIQGIINPGLVREVRKRLEAIDTDIILESGNIEQFIEDNWLSPFPQTQVTEKPDKAAAALAEGRAFILVDGTPFGLIIPATLPLMFQSESDYYDRWIFGTFFRLIRMASGFLALVLPALYISQTAFHPGMIPTPLVISIAATMEVIPIPSALESLLMLLILEAFTEAGIRMPRPLGQAVTIVGGVVIGDAAVRAGLISPLLVITISVTTIVTFVIPNIGFVNAIRILRLFLILPASVLGLYGLILGLMVILIHVTSLKSFGVNYHAPLSPVGLSDWKDMFVRVPIFLQKSRPRMFRVKDIERQ